MIGAVIFDMDGLLVDSERLYLHFLPEALKRFGLPFREEVADRTRGVTNEEGGPIVEEIYSDYPGTDGYAVLSTLQKIVDDYSFEHGVPAKDGAVELLNFLGGRQVPRALASSSGMDIICNNLDHLHLTKAFNVLVSGRDPSIKNSKPAPDIFLAAAIQLGIDPQNTLVLEDSYAGVEAGAAGNFKTIMIPDLSPVTDEMRHLAYGIYPSLNDVTDLLEMTDMDI